ncbi:hypothetical protein HELRODRAFT_116366 [Helobdella robusta]|uniref:Rab-GAP TBC domain-containing protein n=1 Tax=Helobdella robusta TaxID=6412 RepID=T1EGE3_HELRO|nr:hypothetical protein HELRODRAFT_116366 [Helobdella robusta]ESN91098.1 hypothetical protein HELRODRAFT_116366 [Helobdella robusta]
MSLTTFLTKASNLLGLKPNISLKAPPLDGEIIFCKNNVCVHPPANLNKNSEHHPGYMNIRSQEDEVLGRTLILTWIPNSTLTKNPRSIENSPRQGKPLCSTGSNHNGHNNNIRTTKPRNDEPYKDSDDGDVFSITPDSKNFINNYINNDDNGKCNDINSLDGIQAKNKYTNSINMDKDINSAGDNINNRNDSKERNGDDDDVKNEFDLLASTDSNFTSHKSPSNVTQSPSATLPAHGTSSSSPPQSPLSPNSSSPSRSNDIGCNDNSFVDVTSKDGDDDDSSGGVDNDLSFVCGVFSVDLGQMRSLRIFYSNNQCNSGQLVIASRESQYKILHFHHGGLDRLVQTFKDWSFLAQASRKGMEKDDSSHYFSIIRPFLPHELCHPDEGTMEMLRRETWRVHMNDMGVINDHLHLRKAIFFAGIEPSIRAEVWPFLLHYYPYLSTHEDRECIRNDKYLEYLSIRKVRLRMSREEREAFWRSTQCIVEKDVIRTDRSHPYFSGESNPNVDVLKNILLNYAVAHPTQGYTQGMSDLLAPILIELKNESDAYWCFVGLMKDTVFFSSPTDVDMDGQLLYLRELLKLLLPSFYHHLLKLQDGLDLLFCHRWLLLCFKREFAERDALRIWEVCWARYLTDYFHIFIVVSVLSIYGQDVVDQDLPSDDLLLHFNSLSMHMNADMVLKKARGLLHEFCQLETIPCTLHGLCSSSSSSMWDNKYTVKVQCVGHNPNETCPYTETSPTQIKQDSQQSPRSH